MFGSFKGKALPLGWEELHTEDGRSFFVEYVRVWVWVWVWVWVCEGARVRGCLEESRCETMCLWMRLCAHSHAPRVSAVT